MIYKKKSDESTSSLELRRLAPNFVTMVAICIGLLAIKISFEGKYIEAAGLVVLAAFLDAIDGRLARFLNSTSKFGAQLDSLADFTNFGVTPGFVVYNWINSSADIKAFDWALVLLFTLCAAIRLARFNVELEEEGKSNPILEKYFFKGIAAPCGAGIAMLPIIITHEFGYGFYSTPMYTVIYVAIIALLMSSKVPTLSIKKIPVKNEYIYPTLVFLGALIIGLMTELWITLTFVGVTYISSIPVTIFFYLKINATKNKKS